MLNQSKRVITISSGRFRVFTREQIVQAANDILHDGSSFGVQYWILRTTATGVTVDLPGMDADQRRHSSPASIMGDMNRGGIRDVGPVWRFVVMSGDWSNGAAAHHTLESHQKLTPETIDFARRLHYQLMRGPRNFGVLACFLIAVALRRRSFAIVQQQIPVVRLSPEFEALFAPVIEKLRRDGEFDYGPKGGHDG